MTHLVQLNVNGRECEAVAEDRRTLADFLREELGLTGTHLGCEHGVCGACTVIVDGVAVRSCLLLAVQATGSSVTTIEGLTDGDELHPLQSALRDAHSFQCGFCTPGFMMMALTLIEDGLPPTDLELREALAGNLCRCTGYESIIAGVRLAADRMAAGPDAGGLPEERAS